MEGKKFHQEMYEAGMRTGMIAILGFVFIFLLIMTGHHERPLHNGALDEPAPIARSNVPLIDTGLMAAYSERDDGSSSVVGQDKETYNDYLVSIINYDSEGTLEIYKGGTKVHALRNPSNFSFVNVPEGRNYLLLVGTDITGDRKPDLVISEWSLGAHCCYTFHIFEIGDSFRYIQSIDAGNSESAHFRNLDGSPDFEFLMNDWTFAYWLTDFVDSPAPQVILKFNGKEYVFARELMKKPAPGETRLEELARSIQAMDDWRMGIPPVELWQEMISLIYSGNMPQALSLFDRAWPANVEGKEDLLLDFRSKLKESPFAEDLMFINR